MIEQETKDTSGNSDVSILNEESYLRLDGMLSTYDPADALVAQEILYQVKIKESIYWIWLLARKYSHKMCNNRTKRGRAFRDESNLYYLANLSSFELGNWLRKKEWLTPDIFMMIKTEYQERVAHKSNDELYKVTIELKDEYKHLDPTETPKEICT